MKSQFANLNLSAFIVEFPSEKKTIGHQIDFISYEIKEFLEALAAKKWADAHLEAQQIVQCVGYLLYSINVPKYVIDLLTPFQKDYMDLALARAEAWDLARTVIEQKGFDWRLPGRCCRSVKHIPEILGRLYPEIPINEWQDLITRNGL